MPHPILIVAEQLRGQLSDLTFEMLGAGRRLADALGVPLHAVLLGREAAPLADRLGAADQVVVLPNPALDLAPAATVASVLQALLEQQPAGLVLLGATNVSMGLGSALSARTGLPCVNYCRAARVEDGAIVLTSQWLGGKLLADVRLADGRGIATVAPGAFPADAGRSERVPPRAELALPVEPPAVVFTGYLEPDAGDVDITRHDVLVAVGRGIQEQENVALAEELATALGGAVCASRPVIDQGWLPLSRQVGKSGMTVKPRLYLALGISGAPEHWEGMQHAQCIVAINTDPHAPIFDGAQVGVVGDAIELMPRLRDLLKARKA